MNLPSAIFSILISVGAASPSAATFMDMGYEALASRSYPEAIVQFKHAAEAAETEAMTAGDRAAIFDTIGDAYAELGNKSEAERYYLQGRKVRGGQPVPLKQSQAPNSTYQWQ